MQHRDAAPQVSPANAGAVEFIDCGHILRGLGVGTRKNSFKKTGGRQVMMTTNVVQYERGGYIDFTSSWHQNVGTTPVTYNEVFVPQFECSLLS